MIKIGDRVKFLNDVGGGIVTGFIGKNMVNVENEDGFEVPYPLSKLINVDDPALNRNEAIVEKPAEVVVSQRPEKIDLEGKIIAGKDSPDFYFCIVPFDSKNPVGNDINLFLVNDSNYKVLYRFAGFKDEKYTTLTQGILQPNTKNELETINQNDFAGLPDYCFQLIYFRDEDKEWNPAISKKFRVNPVKFYKERSFQPNQFFSKNALVFQISENILDTEIDKLTEDDFRKVVKEKEKPVLKQVPLKPQPPEIVEVDLHIHELVENFTGLTNKEILDIQIEKVENEMRSAIQTRVKRIVFIHGVDRKSVV